MIQGPGPALATHTTVEKEYHCVQMIQSQGLKTHFLTLPRHTCLQVQPCPPVRTWPHRKGCWLGLGKARRAGRFLLPARRSGPPLRTEPELTRCEEEAATLRTHAAPRGLLKEVGVLACGRHGTVKCRQSHCAPKPPGPCSRPGPALNKESWDAARMGSAGDE